MRVKKIKYYFFYLLTENSLYAYTDDKEMVNNFLDHRDMKKFYLKTCSMQSSDLQLLFERDRNWSLLSWYTFETIHDETVKLAITTCESCSIDRIGNQAICVERYTVPRIPPEIFSKEVQDILEKIYYTDSYNFMKDGISDECLLEPNYLMIFLKEFGYTMKGWC